MAFIPVPMVERSKRKEFSMGNGQFLLFKRSCYDLIGGHESLRNKIVEDVWISRRVKEFGQKLIFADGTEILKCRMYNSLTEVWNGFSKNFFAGLAFSFAGLITVIISYFLLFIFPLLTLIYSLIISDTCILFLSVTAFMIPVIIRITHSVKFKQPLMFSILNFLSCIFLISVSINSFRILKFGKGANWKGRDYSENEIK
jgi:chlorobactene glucosyltransferase